MDTPIDDKGQRPGYAKKTEPENRLPDTDLRRQLAKLPKTQLIDQILEFCRHDPSRRQRLLDDLAMLKADRPTCLDQETDGEPNTQSEDLLMLGRRREAFDLLWGSFCDTLSYSYLQRALALAPPAERAALETEALNLAENHADADLALGFLTQCGAFDRIALLVERRGKELCRQRHGGLEAVALNLADTHPEQAWGLLRLMLTDILEMGQANEYWKGCNLIGTMAELAEKGGFMKGHLAFIQQLRDDFSHRSSFWRLAPADKSSVNS